jgi:hypothetical protein
VRGYAPLENDKDALEVRQQIENALTALNFTVEDVRADTGRNIWVIEFSDQIRGAFMMGIARTGS